MLRNIMLLGSVATGIALAVPVIHETQPGLMPGLAKRFLGSDKIEEIPALAMFERDPKNAPTSRRVRLEADRSGHFNGSFRVNGRMVHAMIDTGASVVALNVSTARRSGIFVSTGDFTQAITTANGQIYAAPVTLSKLEIGGIAVRDVGAVILQDSALSGALIGMSFLKGLKRYQFEGDQLILEQ